MNGDPIRTGEFGNNGCGNRIRFQGSAGLTDRSNVIDVYT
jgi:hypothetical protein